jgi:hypothetical protein
MRKNVDDLKGRTSAKFLAMYVEENQYEELQQQHTHEGVALCFRALQRSNTGATRRTHGWEGKIILFCSYYIS